MSSSLQSSFKRDVGNGVMATAADLLQAKIVALQAELKKSELMVSTVTPTASLAAYINTVILETSVDHLAK